MDSLLRLDSVDKTYGTIRRVHALQAVTLDLRGGEHVVILGANGAGKSTLLRLLLGLHPPTRGTVRWERGSRPEIGFAPEHPRLPPRATVRELLGLATDGNGNGALQSAVDALHLDAVLDRRTEALSKGEAQRVSLAFAFLTNAPVLVLDEPFEGLDPMIRPLARAFILSALRAEQTLVATTHRLEEIRAPFRRVLVIRDGRIVKDLTVAELEDQTRGAVLVLPATTTRSVVDRLLRVRGAAFEDVHVVRGTFRDAPAVLVGPFPAGALAGDDVHSLDLETLVQLWMQAPVAES